MKLHFSGKESLSIMWVCAWVGIVASGDSLTAQVKFRNGPGTTSTTTADTNYYQQESRAN